MKNEYMLSSSYEKIWQTFSSFSNFLWNIFPEALAEGNIQRKLEKREKYAIFFEWLDNNMFIINAQNIRDE